MARQVTTLVRVVAVHVACDRCLTRQRIPVLTPDPLDHRPILAPVMDWAAAHHAPHVVQVETETTTAAP